MSVQAIDYFQEASLLRPGSAIRLTGVTWDDYVNLTTGDRDLPGKRVYYDSGTMDIMAPLPIHEDSKGLVHDLVVILADELEVEIESLGSTTLRNEPRGKGAEADDCFYLGSRPEITGKESLNLERESPPDIVVEIDTTSDSLSKVPIYRALRVPEIWRYDGERAYFYRLTTGGYQTVPASPSFPILESKRLSEFLEIGKTRSQSVARRAFRSWLRAKPR
jgi:Uma2 family endonuclease